MTGKLQKLRRTLVMAASAVAVAAIVQQVRRPRDKRTWHGKIMGVPYDFRRPTLARLREKWWNRNGPLFTPHTFGVGWSINLYRLMHWKPPPTDEETTSGG